MIRYVTKKDIDVWLQIASEVEPLFGKMVGCKDFEDGMNAAISDSAAICSVDEQNEVQGIIAVNKAENEIAWLAVREQHHGKGNGLQLIQAGIDALNSQKPIYVHTFASCEKAGAAARELYKRFGFLDERECGQNPAGLNITKMRLAPRE